MSVVCKEDESIKRPTFREETPFVTTILSSFFLDGRRKSHA
jgi:hypothetical protein